MPYFLQGTSQLDNTGTQTIFNGVLFTDGIDLLTQIRDALNNAGWTEVSFIGNVLKMQGVDNGQNCYINFTTITQSATAITLEVQGDIDGTGRTNFVNNVGDPGDERKVSILCRNNLDKLYIVADSGSFILLSSGQTSSSIPIFGGFFARRDITDAGAWGFGYLDWKMTGKYLAIPKYISGEWYEFSDFYYATPGDEPAAIDETSQGFYDLTTDPTINVSGASQTNSANESSYNPEKGAKDGDGKAVIRPFGLKQEQFLQGNYQHLTGEGTGGTPLGEIAYGVVGMASFAQGSQTIVIDNSGTIVETSPSVYETQYYKRTYVTGKIETQGFLIDEQVSTSQFT